MDPRATPAASQPLGQPSEATITETPTAVVMDGSWTPPAVEKK